MFGELRFNFVFVSNTSELELHRSTVPCKERIIGDLLIEDQVWSKVEHGAVGESVGPPAQSEHHHPHP